MRYAFLVSLEVYCFENLYIVLLSIYLFVLIITQAHYIKDRRGSTTRAVFALEASYRWALSGTPFQNHAGELYSLVSALHLKLVYSLPTMNSEFYYLLVFYRFASYK